MDIHLHIDRIVLDGLSLGHHDHHQVMRAVELELANLLQIQGLGEPFQKSGAIPVIPAGTINLELNQNPGSLGQTLARSIYGGLK